MADEEQLGLGATQGVAGGAGEGEGEGDSEQERLKREGADPEETAEKSGPHWWELHPDPAGAMGAAGGEDQIVTGSWGDGKTVADAQLLQAAAQAAAGREVWNAVPAATAAAEGGNGSIGGGGANAGGNPLGERLSGSGAGTRSASITRKTNETDISLTFGVDGTGRSEIETDVPFLNHMLDLFTKHGQFDLRVAARGDVDIDDHHTVEDIGICLGQTLREALGDKRGIKRYANVFIPMDEALAQVVIDISNRPHFEYRAQYPSAQVGSFQVELVHEFLWKFALEARVTLHVIVHYGLNTHHMVEAVFKALGRAIDEATSIDPRVQGVPSTKGVL